MTDTNQTPSMLTAIPCISFIHARCLRAMLESEGIPCLAATILDSGSHTRDSWVLTSSGAEGLGYTLAPLAAGFAIFPNGLDEIAKIAAERGPRTLPVSPEVIATFRAVLVQAARDSSDEVFEMDPAPAVVNNPEGGGYENRCPPVEALR